MITSVKPESPIWGKVYNVEFEWGNGKTDTFSGVLENIDDQYFWFTDLDSGALNVIRKERVIIIRFVKQ